MSKSASKTPAPLVDRIRGSKKNKAGSAASKKSAQGIKLNASIIAGLTKKAKEYNEKHPKNKVSVTTLKAVMRRGMGAYSSSHRPTITGGAPNTRQAWAYARVNAFLRKKGGQGAKPTYVQDNDLLAHGGQLGKEITCVNCGWHWNTNDSDPSDKYVCHKCGYDNRTYYDSEPIGKMADGGLTKSLAIADIHKKYPELPKKYINAQLYIGMKFEMEHTKNPDVAKKIALDHLNESPFYYEYLTKMEKQLEGLDVKKHYQEVKGYAKGGEINPDNKSVKDYFAHGSGNVGGVLVGKRHSEGGIKAVNKSTNQPLEMEGGEVVITRNAVSDTEKREFEGEMLTNREILSRINESGGGVSFADGGDIPESIHTSGKEYAYGGKMVKDHDIVSSCGCKHTMAQGGKIYGQGGVVSMFDKEIPTYVAFQELFNGLKLPNLRKEYEGFLKENYKINFTQLPQKVRTGLLLGSQKLIDNYINK